MDAAQFEKEEEPQQVELEPRVVLPRIPRVKEILRQCLLYGSKNRNMVVDEEEENKIKLKLEQQKQKERKEAENRNKFKKLECPQCNFSCFAPRRMNRHGLTHIYTTRHACSKCQHSFGSPEILALHFKTHGEIPEATPQILEEPMEIISTSPPPETESKEESSGKDKIPLKIPVQASIPARVKSPDVEKPEDLRVNLFDMAKILDPPKSRPIHISPLKPMPILSISPILSPPTPAHMPSPPKFAKLMKPQFDSSDDCLDLTVKSRHFPGRQPRPLPRHRPRPPPPNLVDVNGNKLNVFACPYCEYWTTEDNHLTLHMTIHVHTHDAPYKCSRCEFYSADQTTMAKHSRLHHSGTPGLSHLDKEGREKKLNIKCPHPGCLYYARHPSLLRCHSIVHTGEKAFSCEQCHQRFGRRSDMLRHLRKHSVAKKDKNEDFQPMSRQRGQKRPPGDKLQNYAKLSPPEPQIKFSNELEKYPFLPLINSIMTRGIFIH